MPQRAEIAPIGIALDHLGDDVSRRGLLGHDPGEIRRYCWDSPMIFGVLSFSTFLWIHCARSVSGATLDSPRGAWPECGLDMRVRKPILTVSHDEHIGTSRPRRSDEKCDFRTPR